MLLPENVQNSSKHVYVPSNLGSSFLVSVHDDDPCSSTDSTAAWKRSRLMSSGSDDFHAATRPTRALHALPICVYISASVDAVLLPRIVKDFSDFRALPLTYLIEPLRVELMNLVFLHLGRDRYLQQQFEGYAAETVLRLWHLTLVLYHRHSRHL